MSLREVEDAIAERYSLHGYSISRKNTKTLIVDLPYGVQDFDQFVLDMRLTYGCKIDYDLSDHGSNSIEIRVTPGVHAIMSNDLDSEDDPHLTAVKPGTPLCAKLIVLLIVILMSTLAVYQITAIPNLDKPAGL